MKTPRILIIDDEIIHFDLISRLLRHQDYQLFYESDGRQAIAKLDIYNPDIIMLDQM